MKAEELNMFFSILAEEVECPQSDLIVFYNLDRIDWIPIAGNLVSIIRALKKQLKENK